MLWIRAIYALNKSNICSEWEQYLLWILKIKKLEARRERTLCHFIRREWRWRKERRTGGGCSRRRRKNGQDLEPSEGTNRKRSQKIEPLEEMGKEDQKIEPIGKLGEGDEDENEKNSKRKKEEREKEKSEN